MRRVFCGSRVHRFSSLLFLFGFTSVVPFGLISPVPSFVNGGPHDEYIPRKAWLPTSPRLYTQQCADVLRSAWREQRCTFAFARSLCRRITALSLMVSCERVGLWCLCSAMISIISYTGYMCSSSSSCPSDTSILPYVCIYMFLCMDLPRYLSIFCTCEHVLLSESLVRSLDDDFFTGFH